MKELKEKINTLISDTETTIDNLNYDKECYPSKNISNNLECEKQHLENLNQLLKEIEQEENKPFDPEELDNTCIYDEDDMHKIWSLFLDNFLYTNYDNFYDDDINEEIHYLVIILNKKTGLYNIYLDYLDCLKGNPTLFKIAKNVKIPNHRFGVELLRNLGVIK